MSFFGFMNKGAPPAASSNPPPLSYSAPGAKGNTSVAPSDQVMSLYGESGTFPEADHIGEHETIPSPAVSSFSFMASPSFNDSTDQPSLTSTSSSSFGFMQSTSISSAYDAVAFQSSLDSSSTTSSQSMSAFSFLSASTLPTQSSSMALMSTTSHFPTMSSNHSQNSASSVNIDEQEIKLSKVASAKTVKKKKRASKVGFARDGDDNEDAEDVAPPAAVTSGAVVDSLPVSLPPASSPPPAEPPIVLPTLKEENECEEEEDITPEITVYAAVDHIHIPEAPKSPLPPVPPRGPLPPVPYVDTFVGTITEVGADEIDNEERSSESAPNTFESTEIYVDSSGGSDAQPRVSLLTADEEELLEEPATKQRTFSDFFEGLTQQESPVAACSSIPSPVAVLPIQEPFQALTVAETAKSSGHVSLSSIDLLDLQIRDVCDTLKQSTIKLAQLQESMSRQLRYMKQELDREEREQTELKIKLDDVEADQQRLALLEDFEKADGLNDTIEMLRSRLASTKSRVVDHREHILSLQVGLNDNRKAQVMSLTRTVDKFADAVHQQKSELLTIQSESQRRHSMETVRIKSEEDRITLEKKHIEREEEALGEEAKVTEDAINAQSGDILETKNSLDNQLSLVAREIQELEQALAAKRNEEKQLKSDLSLVESRIHEVRRKYDRQLSRINDRKDSLLRSKTECEGEERVLALEKETFDADVKATAHVCETLTKGSANLLDDIYLIGILKSLLIDLEESSTVQSSSSNSNNAGSPTASETYNHLVANAALADAALLQINSALTELSSQITLLTAESKEIEEKLPKLETEKKGHAQSKRFKEAAAVANTIKLLTSKKEESDNTVVKLTQEVDCKTNEVVELTQKQLVATTALREAQREADIHEFNALLKKISTLRSVTKRIHQHESCKKTKSDASNNMSNRPAGSSVVESCKLYIESEIQSFMGQAQDIQSKHPTLVLEFSDAAALEDESIEVESSPVETVEADAIEPELVTLSPHESDADLLMDCNSVKFEEETTEETSEVELEESSAETAPEAIEPIDTTLLECEREDKIKAAQELVDIIANLGDQIHSASESEDYDLAATIDEECEEKRRELAKLLAEIGCTEEEL